MVTARTSLVVTVDTECDDQWTLDKRQVITLANLREIPRLQSLLDRSGVRPVYLITYPVSRDPDGVSILKEARAHDRCEIGTHLHAWTTPPVTDVEIRQHAYLQNLSPAIQRTKLSALHRSITDAFETPPVSHRGGRWSLDGQAIRLLEDLGYLVDSSVTPGLYWRDGGPDFRPAGLNPYRPDYDDVCRQGTSTILEVPVSISFLPRRPLVERAIAWAPPSLHLEGVTRRLGLVRRVWLAPSLTPTDEMIRLCDALLTSGMPVLNLVFHSSELLPGGSPYHATRADVDRFYGRLDEVLAYLVRDRRLESVTLADLGRRWQPASRQPIGSPR